MTITLQVNGDAHTLPNGVTLDQLVIQFSRQTGAVVAVNDTFIPRSQHASWELRSGDRVELLTPMEGG